MDRLRQSNLTLHVNVGRETLIRLTLDRSLRELVAKNRWTLDSHVSNKMEILLESSNQKPAAY